MVCWGWSMVDGGLVEPEDFSRISLRDSGDGGASLSDEQSCRIAPLTSPSSIFAAALFAAAVLGSGGLRGLFAGLSLNV